MTQSTDLWNYSKVSIQKFRILVRTFFLNLKLHAPPKVYDGRLLYK